MTIKLLSVIVAGTVSAYFPVAALSDTGGPWNAPYVFHPWHPWIAAWMSSSAALAVAVCWFVAPPASPAPPNGEEEAILAELRRKRKP